MVFPIAHRKLEEDMGLLRHMIAMYSMGGAIENEDIIEDMVFSIDRMNRKISPLKRLELGKPSIDPGKSDVTITHTFKSSDRNLYVIALEWRVQIT